jgi:hypothetical protein
MVAYFTRKENIELLINTCAQQLFGGNGFLIVAELFNPGACFRAPTSNVYFLPTDFITKRV